MTMIENEEKESTQKFCLHHGARESAKAHLKKIRDVLEAEGYTLLDHSLLQMYFEHYSLWHEARRQVQLEGMTLVDKSGKIYRHPMLPEMEVQSRRLLAVMTALGMTPQMRRKLVKIQEEAELDPLF